MPDFKSPNFSGKIFINPIPSVVTKQGAFLKILRENFFDKNKHLREPKSTLGPFKTNVGLIKNLPNEILRVTWLGHSTILIEIDGKRFLTDPVWSKRVSPFGFIGPVRFFEPPLSLDDLPPLDGVIISHDHYDHLDASTVKILAAKGNNFFCPLGVSKWLKKFGVQTSKINEFDWWDELELGGGFKIAATPARHFSGRGINDRYKTLWASWALIGTKNRMYFGADSGMFPGFTDIGHKYGPFDLTALEIGAAHDDWEDIHMGPHKAADAHLMLRGKLMLPIHWATFNLAHHPWEEPIESLIPYTSEKGIKLVAPEPGETVLITDEYNTEWWKRY